MWKSIATVHSKIIYYDIFCRNLFVYYKQPCINFMNIVVSACEVSVWMNIISTQLGIRDTLYSSHAISHLCLRDFNTCMYMSVKYLF